MRIFDNIDITQCVPYLVLRFSKPQRAKIHSYSFVVVVVVFLLLFCVCVCGGGGGLTHFEPSQSLGGGKREIPEKNLLTARKQNLACLTCDPSQNSEMTSVLERFLSLPAPREG